MRKTNLLLAALVFAFSACSQNLPDISSIKLDKKEDFNSIANDAALKVSDYLLTTPIEKDNAARLAAGVYLIKWMTGTPAYYFSLDEDAAELAKKNDDLFMVFMAAMTKYVLENPSNADDVKKVKLNSIKTLIKYAKNPKNNVNLNSDLTKTI
jgi:hypothetical protein